MPSASISFRVTTSPASSPSRTSTTLSDSFRTTSLPLRMIAGVDVGVQGDPHLAATGEDVDRAVLVDAEEGAVGGRGLGELLDLLAQGGQLLLGLLQGEGQLLVLGDGVGQLALGLEQPLLERLHPPRALLKPAPEGVDLFFCLRKAGCGGSSSSAPASCSFRIRRRTHLPAWPTRAHPTGAATTAAVPRRPDDQVTVPVQGVDSVLRSGSWPGMLPAELAPAVAERQLADRTEKGNE